jgi:hypothetical protein
MSKNSKDVLIKRTWSSVSEDSTIHSGDVIGSDSVLSAQSGSDAELHGGQHAAHSIARPPLVPTSHTVEFLRFTLPDIAYRAAGAARSVVRVITHSLFDSPTAPGSPTVGPHMAKQY